VFLNTYLDKALDSETMGDAVDTSMGSAGVAGLGDEDISDMGDELTPEEEAVLRAQMTKRVREALVQLNIEDAVTILVEVEKQGGVSTNTACDEPDRLAQRVLRFLRCRSVCRMPWQWYRQAIRLS